MEVIDNCLWIGSACLMCAVHVDQQSTQLLPQLVSSVVKSIKSINSVGSYVRMIRFAQKSIDNA